MDMKTLSPSFLGIYNLSTSDLNNFLDFLSVACSSLFLKLTNTAEYLNRDTNKELTPRSKFPPFRCDFKTYLNLLPYSFGTFKFIFLTKNLSASKILKYL